MQYTALVPNCTFDIFHNFCLLPFQKSSPIFTEWTLWKYAAYRKTIASTRVIAWKGFIPWLLKLLNITCFRNPNCANRRISKSLSLQDIRVFSVRSPSIKINQICLTRYFLAFHLLLRKVTLSFLWKHVLAS